MADERGYVLGIDQGSTHTRALIADQHGHLLGLGWAAGACHAFSGMQKAMLVIREAANSALAQAGADAQRIIWIHGGLTGADWADEYLLLQENIRALGLCANVSISNDSIVALRGGTDRPYGAILIAGSGGNCAVRAPDGREFIYGYYHDPALQGGGALGRQTLQAIYRAYTGRERPTSLTRRVLGMLGLNSVDELLRADVEHRLPVPVKDLAPLLFEEGCCGDSVAQRIIREFGQGYAELATAVLQRFDMTGMEVEIVLSGSVFKARGSLLVETIAAGIQAVVPRAKLVNARYEPVVGAVLLALENLGLEIEAPIRANVESGAQRLDLIRNVV